MHSNIGNKIKYFDVCRLIKFDIFRLIKITTMLENKGDTRPIHRQNEWA